MSSNFKFRNFIVYRHNGATRATFSDYENPLVYKEKIDAIRQSGGIPMYALTTRPPDDPDQWYWALHWQQSRILGYSWQVIGKYLRQDLLSQYVEWYDKYYNVAHIAFARELFTFEMPQYDYTAQHGSFVSSRYDFRRART